MKIALIYILISVINGAIGQLLLKKGMSTMGPITLSLGEIGTLLWKMGTNPFVVTGLGIYALSTVIWLAALSRVDLSYAYPFVSLSYVIMLIASWFLFHENITPLRLLGTLVIVVGVLLVSRS